MTSDIVQKALSEIDRDIGLLSKPSASFHCSGVLPYCICGTLVYFILGRTRSGKLLTFTGKAEQRSYNSFEAPATTAAREFYEETLGCIMGYDQCLAATQACDKSSVLVSTTPKHTICYTFLVCVPFKRHYALNFARTRDFLSFINVNEPHLTEFCEIKGIGYETLVKISASWCSAGMNMSDAEWDKIKSLIPKDTDDNQLHLADWRYREDLP